MIYEHARNKIEQIQSSLLDLELPFTFRHHKEVCSFVIYAKGDTANTIYARYMKYSELDFNGGVPVVKLEIPYKK